jgi:hypothetical protein
MSIGSDLALSLSLRDPQRMHQDLPQMPIPRLMPIKPRNRIQDLQIKPPPGNEDQRSAATPPPQPRSGAQTIEPEVE